MYWTCWGSQAFIEKASMDGANRRILHSTGLVWPNGLALDIQTQTLFWADSSLDKIECSAVDGSNRQLIFQAQDSFQPFGIAVSFGGIYITDWENNAIRYIRSGENEATELTRFSSSCDRPSGIQFVSQYKQPPG